MPRVRERFDPDIGAFCAQNWWQLGAHIEIAQERPEELVGVCKGIIKQLSEEGYTAQEIGQIRLTPEALVKFYGEVYELLKLKFDGKPIHDRFNRLVQSHVIRYKDDDRFFNFVEDDEAFWTLEYDAIFDELKQPLRGTRGWLAAVGLCKNPTCKKFFIKTRSNQQHHSESCRLQLANRELYRRKHKKKRATRARRRG